MPVSRSVALFIWLVASVFYAWQYVLRVMPGIMMVDITRQFHIDAVIFGQFSGVYYIGYSLMHIPIGIMLDRFGPRKVMTGCILLTVIGLLPILFAENWIYPVLGRALIGMGSSAAILGTFKIIRMAYSEKHFTRMLGLSVTIGLLGAIYGGGPVAYLSLTLGYKMVVEIFACFGVVLALITWCIVPEMARIEYGSIFSNMKEVITNRRVVLLCLFAGFMVGPLEGFADVWGAGFLKQVYGFDTKLASYIPSMIFFGMCFGAPVLSYVAEKSGNYLAVTAASGVVMMLGFIALVAGVLTESTMIVAFIIVGVCSAYQILAIYKASTWVPEHVVGLTTAVANMIIMSFGYAFHTIIGIVVNSFGGVDATKALVYGIGVIPLTLAIGAAGFFFLWFRESKS
jgi:predicted MFS family arabinose efflux permease